MEQNILIGIAGFLQIIELINGVVILTVPSEGYVGQSTSLSCTEVGFNAAIGYSWLKDSTSIYNHNGVVGTFPNSKYIGSDDVNGFYLTINNLTVSDEADYRCDAGFSTTTNQLLKIISKAQVPDNAETTSGKLIITFTEIYPDTTTVTSVTCDSTNIPGSLETTSSAGSGLFDATWKSTAVFPDSVNQAAECTATLQGYTISYDVIFSIEATTTTTTTIPSAGKDPCKIVWDIILLILVIIVAAAIIISVKGYPLVCPAKPVTDGDGYGLSTFAIVGIVSGIIAAVGIIVNIIVCVVTLDHPNCSLSIYVILGIVIGSIDVVAIIAVIVYVIITQQGDTAKGALELKSNGRTEDGSADKRP